MHEGGEVMEKLGGPGGDLMHTHVIDTAILGRLGFLLTLSSLDEITTAMDVPVSFVTRRVCGRLHQDLWMLIYRGGMA